MSNRVTTQTHKVPRGIEAQRQGALREEKRKGGGGAWAVPLSPLCSGTKMFSCRSPLPCANFLNSSKASGFSSAFLPVGRGPGEQGSSDAELWREPVAKVKSTDQHWACQPGAVRRRGKWTLAMDKQLWAGDAQTPSDPGASL